jgi:hypothetical protein
MLETILLLVIDFGVCPYDKTKSLLIYKLSVDGLKLPRNYFDTKFPKNRH